MHTTDRETDPYLVQVQQELAIRGHAGPLDDIATVEALIFEMYGHSAAIAADGIVRSRAENGNVNRDPEAFSKAIHVELARLDPGCNPSNICMGQILPLQAGFRNNFSPADTAKAMLDAQHADWNVVSTYTAQQAVDDGTLADLPADPTVPMPDAAPLFELGKVRATPAALELLGHSGAMKLLNRHQTGDWGEFIDAGDARLNLRAIRDDDRIFSAYKVGDEKLYVITEHDRSATTVMIAHEY